MRRVKQTFTIEATEDTMQKFLRFLASMHFNGGHSGLFAMPFDGDGHEFLKVEEGLPKELSRGNNIANSGATIEVAMVGCTEGYFIDYSRNYYQCGGDGNMIRKEHTRC